jgi:hypothetical protein
LASAEENGKKLMLAAATMAATLCTLPRELKPSRGNNFFIYKPFEVLRDRRASVGLAEPKFNDTDKINDVQC